MVNSTSTTLYEDWKKSTSWNRRIIIVQVTIMLLAFAVAFISAIPSMDATMEKLNQNEDVLVIPLISIIAFAIGLSASCLRNICPILCANWIKSKQIDYRKYFDVPYNKSNDTDYVSTSAAYMCEHKQEKNQTIVLFIIGFAITFAGGIFAGFAGSDLIREFQLSRLHVGYTIQVPIIKIVLWIVLEIIGVLPTSVKWHKTKILAWRQEIMQSQKKDI